jgi:ribonuclease Y
VFFLYDSITVGTVGLAVGLAVAFLISWIRARQRHVEIEGAKTAAARIIEEAKRDATAIKKEAEIQAKDSVLKERAELEREVRETRR